MKCRTHSGYLGPLLAADFKRFSFINSAHLPPIDAPMRLPSHRALWRLCFSFFYGIKNLINFPSCLQVRSSSGSFCKRTRTDFYVYNYVI